MTTSISQMQASVLAQSRGNLDAEYVALHRDGIEVLQVPGAGLDQEASARAFCESVVASLEKGQAKFRAGALKKETLTWKHQAGKYADLLLRNVLKTHGPHLTAAVYLESTSRVVTLASQHPSKLAQAMEELEAQLPHGEDSKDAGVQVPASARHAAIQEASREAQRGHFASTIGDGFACDQGLLCGLGAYPPAPDAPPLGPRELKAILAQTIQPTSTYEPATFARIFHSIRKDPSLSDTVLEHVRWVLEHLRPTDDEANPTLIWQPLTMLFLSLPAQVLRDKPLSLALADQLVRALVPAIGVLASAGRGMAADPEFALARLQARGLQLLEHRAREFMNTPVGGPIVHFLLSQATIMLHAALRLERFAMSDAGQDPSLEGQSRRVLIDRFVPPDTVHCEPLRLPPPGASLAITWIDDSPPPPAAEEPPEDDGTQGPQATDAPDPAPQEQAPSAPQPEVQADAASKPLRSGPASAATAVEYAPTGASRKGKNPNKNRRAAQRQAKAKAEAEAVRAEAAKAQSAPPPQCNARQPGARPRGQAAHWHKKEHRKLSDKELAKRLEKLKAVELGLIGRFDPWTPQVRELLMLNSEQRRRARLAEAAAR